MKRQRAEISSNVISHIKSAHPIEMWRSNKLGIKEKISRGEFPRPIFSCPVPSGLPHGSHCVPMNMNPWFSVLFCYKNATNIVGQGVGQILTHTLTHLPKCAERVKEHRRGSCFLSDALLERCLYLTCAMKLPIVCAASSCFCLVAWV